MKGDSNRLQNYILICLLSLFSVCSYGSNSVGRLPVLDDSSASATNIKSQEISSQIKKYKQLEQQKQLSQGISYEDSFGQFKPIKSQNLKKIKKNKKMDTQTNPYMPQTDNANSINSGNNTSTTLAGINQANDPLFNQAYQAATKQLDSLIKLEEQESTSFKPTFIQAKVSSKKTKVPNKMIQETTENHSQNYSQNNSESKKPNILSIYNRSNNILPGDTYFGVLQSEVNSDYQGPVVANIVNGKLRGAKLIGSFERRNDKIGITFHQMVFQTQLYSVNAIAVDSNNYRTVLADSVDRHLIKRYGLFFLASFGDEYATALESGSTSMNAGGVINTKNKLSPRERLGYATGKTGKAFLPILKNAINTPPTVIVNRGDGIGIMFQNQVKLKPTFEKGDQPDWLKSNS